MSFQVYILTTTVSNVFRYGDYSMRGGGLGPIHLGDVTCLTGARTLNECRLSSIANCSHDHDLWLTCCKSRVTSPGTMYMWI